MRYLNGFRPRIYGNIAEEYCIYKSIINIFLSSELCIYYILLLPISNIYRPFVFRPALKDTVLLAVKWNLILSYMSWFVFWTSLSHSLLSLQLKYIIHWFTVYTYTLWSHSAITNIYQRVKNIFHKDKAYVINVQWLNDFFVFTPNILFRN